MIDRTLQILTLWLVQVIMALMMFALNAAGWQINGAEFSLAVFAMWKGGIFE